MSLRNISLIASAAALSATSALAGGFAIKEGSVSSQGMSFSNYTAGAEDITHIYQNPAALQRTTGEGFTIGASASLIAPSAEGEFTGEGPFAGLTGDGNPSKLAVVPGTYMGYRLNDKMVLGFSLTSPFGLRTEYDISDSIIAQSEATETDLKLIVATPMISGELMNGVDFGFGFSLAYADLTFNSTSAEYRGDDFSFGFVLGTLADLTDTTTLGISYRSGFKLDAEGTLQGSFGSFGDTSFEADAPGVLSVGIKQELSESVDLSVEAQWQNWHVLDVATISTGVLPDSEETFGYEDAFFIAGGVEYEHSEALKLRTGVAWDQTPTTDQDRSIRVPDEDRIWLSLGASYNLTPNMKIDLAYSYIFTLEDPVVESIIVPTGPATEADGGDATFDADVHIISIGASMDF